MKINTVLNVPFNTNFEINTPEIHHFLLPDEPNCCLICKSTFLEFPSSSSRDSV